MRPVNILAAIVLNAAMIGFVAPAGASASNNPVAVGPSWFCDSSKIGQVCQTDIQTGDSVTWTVQTGAGSHTVTQCTDATFSNCGNGFESGILSEGGTFTQSFANTGSFYYYCGFHPLQMRGVIVAAQAATPTPSPSSAPGSATPTASAGPTRSPTTAGLPSTGGAPSTGAGASSWEVLAVALTLLMVGAGGMAAARRRTG
jgi:hypothetical protein